MTPRRSRIAKWFAALLIRGADAPFVLRDLEDAFAQDLARGLTPSHARRRDLRNVFESAASLWSNAVRLSAWRPSLIDVKLGLRSIIRTPGLSIVAVCALAIGIPVGLAPMHAVDVLERPLPGDPDGRVRTLCFWRDANHEPPTEGDFLNWKKSLRSWSALAAYRPAAINIDAADGGPIAGVETTSSMFDVLRASARLGRVLRADDERVGGPNVVVISDELWRTRFAGDTSVIGRAMPIGGAQFAVVGVMPPGFQFPSAHQVWLPLRLRDDGAQLRSGGNVVVFGRLADGATPDAAQAELQTLTSANASIDPAAFDRLRASVLPSWHLTFGFPSPGGLRALPEFYAVQLLMLAPLLIACVNVGLLVLAQTSTRASEFAMRTALGASRGRILVQVFVEFAVLAVIATGAGLLVLDWIPGRLLPALGIVLPYWIDTSLSASTVFRALILAAGCAAAAGVVPAIRMTGRSVERNIKRTRASRIGGLPSVLIVTDVAVAVVAIGVAAGLWGKVQATQPSERFDGVRAAEILSVTVTDAGGGVGDHSAPRSNDGVGDHSALRSNGGVGNHSALRVIERLRAEPGVRAATFATALPRTDHAVRVVEIDQNAGAAPTPAAAVFKVRVARVAVDYFDQLQQPLVAGRAFDTRDLSAGAHSVIVNTTFAERAFGSTNVIGRRVRETTSDRASSGAWLDIVGVVGHMGMHAITPSQDDGVYFPIAAGVANPVQLAIWTRGNAAALIARVHDAARAVAPGAAISVPAPLDQMFEGDWYFLRAFVVAAAILVGVLLSLAASALYAILSLVVSERTREIGIRVALGANQSRIVRDVAARAIAQIGVGVLLGLPFAGALCYEFLELRGSGSLPGAVGMAFVLGASVMLLVSVAACTTPTLRALRIQPVDALRKDG